MKSRVIRDYLEDILNSVEDVANFVRGMSFDDFARDKKTINAVIRSLEVIGEAAKKIPAPIRNKNPLVPWKRMAGMRDKMIHEYFGIDIDMVWKTVKDDLIPLKSSIANVIRHLDISK